MLVASLLGCAPADFAVRRRPSQTTPTPPTLTIQTGTRTNGGDPYAALPPPPELTADALAGIAADIDAIRAATTATTGVYVVDLENGQVVYAHDEDVPQKPASNTKLFTSLVAFDALGEDHRLDVSAWADRQPDTTGAVGELTVVGLHDFTWSTYFYESPEFAAERLADRLWDAGLREVGELVVGGEYLVEGYSLGTYDAAWYRAVATDTVTSALEDRGVAVGVVTESASFAEPPGSVLVAARGSPPLAVGVHPLNVYSHNEFADILSHHLGLELAGASTYDAGTDAVVGWLDGAGLDTSGLALNDGSGLSHDNRVTPRQVVELLAYGLGRPAGLAWERTFSTGGVLGTLGSRMTGPDTLGRFHGKSGTLTGVIATSGVLHHAHDGHRYLVSVLMNDVADSDFARSLQDDVVEVIARDNRGLGPRPGGVVLRRVAAQGDGTLAITWDAVPEAQGYALWFSPDALVWDRADARYVEGLQTFVAGGLEPDATWHVRVHAISAAGESDPSDVLSARTSSVPSEVLLVDADDRWALQWENPMGFGHDFLALHAEALGGRPFESAANEAVLDGTVDLRDYAVVLWVLGEESDEDETFSDAEQVLLAEALAAGTGALVSGAEVGWDLSELGSDADRAFFEDVLHAGYVADAALTYSVEPVPGGLFDGLGELGFYAPGTEEVAYPDVLAPGAGAVAELSYVGGIGGTAAISAPGVVLLGFPFETLDDAATREAVMERALGHLGL